MSDLADYLQWKRDAAELAALRAEVVQLRAERVTAQRTIRKQSALLSHYRRKYNIVPRSQVRKEIIQLMEKGLRNCEIVALGFSKNTIEKIRKLFKEATTCK